MCFVEEVGMTHMAEGFLALERALLPSVWKMGRLH